SVEEIVKLRLPQGWKAHDRSGLLTAIALANHLYVSARSVWAQSDRRSSRRELEAQLDAVLDDNALLREENRIVLERMRKIPPKEPPRYPGLERLAILALQAARGWSMDDTAEHFLITGNAVRSWHRRVDEEGPEVLVRTPQPVNKFPDWVRLLVQELQT